MKKLYLIFSLIALNSTVLFAQIYVTEAGAGNKDGTSWANAYDNTQLQTAITGASSGQQVWVAKGTYTPTINPISGSVDNRDRTFLMKRGVSVYGSFAGTEPEDFNLDSRDFVNNKTTLSGDFNGNDIEDPDDLNYATIKAENAYHVVIVADGTTASAPSYLDGFTISGGYADGTATEVLPIGSTLGYIRNRGAGITSRGTGAYNVRYRNLVIEYNVSTNYAGGVYFYTSGDNTYTMENVSFKENRSTYAGAIYINRASGNPNFTLTDVKFQANKAATNSGGAIYHSSSTTTLTIIHSTFENNVSNNQGGAIFLNTGSLNIQNSTFDSNSGSTSHGGAISSGSTATALTIVNSIFKNNIANSAGGAIYLLYPGTANISACEFNSNTAGASGGAIFNYIGTLSVSKSKFYSNTADSGAGAIQGSSNTVTEFSTTNIDNSVFYNNTSNATTVSGVGAVYTNTYANSTTINSTFFQNKSASVHGAISFNNAANTTVKLYNNIFNGNIGSYNTTPISADIRQGNAATMDFRNNLLQAFNQTSSGNDTFSDNILNDAPLSLFASTTEGDYNFLYPANNSIGMDLGDNTLYTDNVGDINTATDILGNTRLINGGIAEKVDLGAIEWSTVLPVKVSSFTASLANNNRTQLKWNVGTEDNVNRYEIERSQNGADFSKVAAVSANGSASYQTTDNSPQVGDNYYRLVTIDNDGSRSQYDVIRVVKVASLATQSVQVYPNPVKGNEVRVSLDSPAGTYNYKVVSTSGSVVQQSSVNYNGSSAVINLSPVVTSGVYILYFSNGTQAKLVKQ